MRFSRRNDPGVIHDAVRKSMKDREERGNKDRTGYQREDGENEESSFWGIEIWINNV